MSRVKRGPWRGGVTPQVAQNADPTQPRLTTAAMIASLAAEGQRTSPAAASIRFCSAMPIW